ncbi:CAP domain-containing protein [Psychromonas sp. KJ10-2]|uniref:CAP domain-containing protein n=1 Tax=Psychromonas sp. KJ10-2 TaxID=3391822 RepID=UPI0039B5F7DA
MKSWLALLCCGLSLTACGSSSSNSSGTVETEATSNTSSTTVQTDSTETSTDETTDSTDYSAMSCEDNLIEALTLINQLRAESQTCGATTYPAVDAVTWSSVLTLAAEEHSSNMANYNFFSHTGLDDSTVGTRVTAQGYEWSYVSENIAAGQTSVQDAVDGWMESEGHCINIMSENAQEMGLACAVNSDADYQYYWTQVFAKPLQ